MTTFEQWYTDLAQDQIWFEQATMNHRTETVMAVARQIWVNGLAEGESFKLIPMRAHRQHLFNKLSKLPPDRPKKKWYLKEEDKTDAPKEEHQPLTGEAREKRIKEFLELLAKVGQPIRNIPEKDVFEEGQWDKKKLVEMVPSKVEQVIAAREHLATAQRARRKLFTEAFPDASEEEIQAYLDKFKEIDNPLNL